MHYGPNIQSSRCVVILVPKVLNWNKDNRIPHAEEHVFRCHVCHVSFTPLLVDFVARKHRRNELVYPICVRSCDIALMSPSV